MVYNKQFWKVVKLINWDAQCHEDSLEQMHEDLKDFCIQEGISLDKFQDYLHKFESNLWDLVKDKELNQWKYKQKEPCSEDKNKKYQKPIVEKIMVVLN